MNNRPKVRIAMIGAGGIAQAYAQSFTKSTRAELVVVCDVREEAAAAVAETAKCKVATDYTKLLDDVACDAVLVCTPPSTHPEICIHFLEKGIHVLCEKPLAVDSESAIRMVDAAEKAGVKFTMASKFRYVDDVNKAKAIITSGILGELILFENTFAGHVDMSKRWNSDPMISGGGVMIDNGTHSVDIARYLLGPLAEIQAVEGKRIQDLPVEDTVRIAARTQDGVMASIDLSWSLNKQTPEYISIYGAQGTILIGWRESKYRRNSDQDWIVFGNGYNKFDAFTNQIENFAGAIQGDETLLIKPEDALASVAVIEVAYEAMWRNTWMPVSHDIVQAKEKA